MLKPETTLLVLIDVQEKLFRIMPDKEKLLDNLMKLVRGCHVLDVPVIVTEQYPQGLGPTVPELARLLTGVIPIPKVSFSCWGEQRFLAELKKFDHHQILLAGIETHVCIYQTAAHLLDNKYEVEVVADAVASRIPENKVIGLQKMTAAGAALTSVEMALFEMLGVGQGERLKQISAIVK